MSSCGCWVTEAFMGDSSLLVATTETHSPLPQNRAEHNVLQGITSPFFPFTMDSWAIVDGSRQVNTTERRTGTLSRTALAGPAAAVTLRPAESHSGVRLHAPSRS